jgi:uncharacterized protein (TIGR03067 family)
MDPAVRESLKRLDERLSSLSSQMDELRQNVRQVAVVAEADPEMALTKARKVLESVLRRVWEHFLPNEPVGTRPLEEVLQRLQKNGYLPRKQAAYAVAVKELGNVGTHVHDEKIDKKDVAQALNPLISVLEWYFDQDWVEGGAAAYRDTADPPVNADFGPVHVGAKPRRAWRARLVVVGLAFTFGVMLAAVITAGFSGMFRAPKTSSPVAEPAARTVAEPVQKAIAPNAPRSDEDRIQGRWQSVEGHSTMRKTADIKQTAHEWVWTFRGSHLSTALLIDGKAQANDRGLFALSRRGEQGLFDFQGKRPNGAAVELRGIYKFEGELLRVCYTMRGTSDQSRDFVRPAAFVLARGSRGLSLKFKRVGD